MCSYHVLHCSCFLLYYMKHDKLVFTCHKYYHGTINKTINDYYIIHSYTTITTLI